MGKKRDIEYATLDGYIVHRATPSAVGIVKSNSGLVNGGHPLVWIPRSLCENGFHLTEGDTDLMIESWKAEQEELDF